ncbi:MAG: hypothetical protein ACYDEC_02520 [Bacteroidia bacterium]
MKDEAVLKHQTNHTLVETKKPVVTNSAERSKKAVEGVIDLNNKFLEHALDKNKQNIEETTQQFPAKEGYGSLFEILNHSLGKSAELSAKTINDIVKGYNRQVELYGNYNTKLMDAIKETTGSTINPVVVENILNQIHENFELCLNVMNMRMKSIIESYHKHTTLALNLNHKFSDNITSQIHLFKDMQQNNTSFFNDLATEWWKDDEDNSSKDK